MGQKVGTRSGWVVHKYSELANMVCVGPSTQKINNKDLLSRVNNLTF